MVSEREAVGMMVGVFAATLIAAIAVAGVRTLSPDWTLAAFYGSALASALLIGASKLFSRDKRLSGSFLSGFWFTVRIEGVGLIFVFIFLGILQRG